METVTDFIFLGSKIIADGDSTQEIKKNACSLEEKLWPTYTKVKKQRHCLANRGPSGQIYSISSSHIWMWDLDYKESW